MAVSTDTVITVLKLEDRQFNAQVRSNEQQFTQAKNREAAAAEASERRIRAASSGVRSVLLGTAATIAAGFSVQAVAGLADSYTRFTNQLKVAGLEGAALARTQEDLYQVAQRYGVQLEVLGRLYGGLSVLQKDLNTTSTDSLGLTTAVAQAIKVNGSSAAAASGAILGLNQALAQARVQSDEYNQILDGARPLLLAAVQASDRYGGSLAKLKQDIEAGKVSGADLFRILQGGFPVLADQAAKASLTIGNSLQILNNALGKYIGQTDTALSATERVSAGIKLLADNLNVLVPALGVLVTIIGARYISAAVAATAATIANADAHAFRTAMLRAEAIAEAQMLPITSASTAAMLRQNAALVANAGRLTGAAGAAARFGSGLVALAGGPVGIAILAVAALAAGILYLHNRYQQQVVVERQLQASQTAVSTALDKYREAATRAARATGEQAKEARAAAEAARFHALREIRRAQALAVSTAEIYRNTAALAALAAEEAQRPRARDPGEVGGSLALAGGLEARAATAKRQADQAEAQVRQARADYAQLQADINNSRLGGTPPVSLQGDDDGRRRRRDTGLSEEEKAELRQRQAIEQEIALARARGDEVAERAAQRRLDILQLTEDYERAGVENARAKAEADIDAVMAAEAAQREVDKLLEQSEKRNERRAEQQRREQDALDRQLETQIALARIEGNEALVRLLERELELRRQIAQLGPEATPDEIQSVRDDQRVINDAEDRAREVDKYRGYARVFVDAIRESDSLGDFFKNLGVGLADKLTDRLAERLENEIAQLLEMIFSQVMGSARGGGGGGWGDLITSGIRTVFGGGRAGGGPVMAGQTVRVNENTPNSEWFTPSVSGYVTPSAQGPVRSRGGGGMSFTYAPTLNAQGAGPREVDELKAAMARDQRTFPQRVRAVVNDGLAKDRIGAPAWKA